MIVGMLGTDFFSCNLGCGALGYSAVEILNTICKKREERLELYVFLYKVDSRPESWDANITLHYVIIGTKKLSFWRNALQVFKRCDFVWDFTGGDSFSDIYGMKRFCLTSALKQLAIWSKTPFIMAPQTIGPFEKKIALMWAKRILKRSARCFVRDSISEEYVKTTFGITPLVTTDVAFSLPYAKENKKAEGKISVGINPSGLLWIGTKEFCVSKHITLDYKEYVRGVMEFLCKDDRYAVYLIPHVFIKDLTIQGENDWKACYELKEMFPQAEILSDFETPMGAKRVISSMDVFIGARMHATIAAFSTGVVTIPVSYSRKFEGLYQDLGYSYLVGATYMNTQEAIEKTIKWITEKEVLAEKVKASGKLIEEKQHVLIDFIERSGQEEK